MVLWPTGLKCYEVGVLTLSSFSSLACLTWEFGQLTWTKLPPSSPNLWPSDEWIGPYLSFGEIQKMSSLRSLFLHGNYLLGDLTGCRQVPFNSLPRKTGRSIILISLGQPFTPLVTTLGPELYTFWQYEKNMNFWSWISWVSMCTLVLHHSGRLITQQQRVCKLIFWFFYFFWNKRKILHCIKRSTVHWNQATTGPRTKSRSIYIYSFSILGV